VHPPRARRRRRRRGPWTRARRAFAVRPERIAGLQWTDGRAVAAHGDRDRDGDVVECVQLRPSTC
jgi:hypothetical protein